MIRGATLQMASFDISDKSMLGCSPDSAYSTVFQNTFNDFLALGRV